MVVGEAGKRSRLGDHRRLRGRPGDRGGGGRPDHDAASAARDESRRRGSLGDRAHLRRHDRGLRRAAGARPARTTRLRVSTIACALMPRAEASAPSSPGWTADGGKLLVLDDGTTEGTPGRSGARPSASSPRRGRRSAQGASRTAGHSRACARSSRSSRPPALLVVVGASHVAMPLTDAGPDARLSHGRDRRPAAVRHRASASPTSTTSRSASPPSWSPATRSSPSTALVLVAHDYKYDLPVLHHALGHATSATSACSARSRRGAAILKLLREDGVDEASLPRGCVCPSA